MGESIDFTRAYVRRQLADSPEPIVLLPLMHYRRGQLSARYIMQEKLVLPGEQEPLHLSGAQGTVFTESRVNFTSVLPERGREQIAAATGLDPQDVNYGIEMLVPAARLTQAFGQYPESFQIFSREAVWVHPMRLWHMDEVERRLRNGWELHRYHAENGLPYAEWRPTEQRLNRPHHGHGFYGTITDRLA